MQSASSRLEGEVGTYRMIPEQSMTKSFRLSSSATLSDIGQVLKLRDLSNTKAFVVFKAYFLWDNWLNQMKHVAKPQLKFTASFVT